MKTRKQTIIISLMLLIIYNIIAFVIPSIKNITFWVAYVFSNLSIIVSSLVILGALDEKSIKQKFKNMPIVYAAYTYLVLQLIIGFVEICRPIDFRHSILINVILFGVSIVTLLITSSGKKEIERVEEKVKEKLFFLKDLQVDIETFKEKISDEQAKKNLNSLVDTIKYSDPMTHSKLATVENQINVKVSTLIQNTSNIELINQTCDELQQLFAERNRKAKLYKNEPEQDAEPQKPLNFKLIITVIVTIIVLIIIGVTLYFTVIIPNKEYDNAMNLFNNKQYIEAKEAFEKIGDYKDSIEKQKEAMNIYRYESATKLFNEKEYLKASEEFSKIPEYKDSKEKSQEALYLYATELLNKKDYSRAAEQFLILDNYKDSKDKVIQIYNLFGEENVVYFGKYNGKPIAWQILDTREHKVLLITRDIVNEMAYNTEYKAITWENSEIRRWLNEDFYSNLEEKERDRIIKGNEQTDYIFLLSGNDIKNYKNMKNASSSWWLATSGDETTKIMYVATDGTVNTEGDIVTKLHGIRPVIWLNLD